MSVAANGIGLMRERQEYVVDRSVSGMIISP